MLPSTSPSWSALPTKSPSLCEIVFGGSSQVTRNNFGGRNDNNDKFAMITNIGFYNGQPFHLKLESALANGVDENCFCDDEDCDEQACKIAINSHGVEEVCELKVLARFSNLRVLKPEHVWSDGSFDTFACGGCQDSCCPVSGEEDSAEYVSNATIIAGGQTFTGGEQFNAGGKGIPDVQDPQSLTPFQQSQSVSFLYTDAADFVIGFGRASNTGRGKVQFAGVNACNESRPSLSPSKAPSPSPSRSELPTKVPLLSPYMLPSTSPSLSPSEVLSTSTSLSRSEVPSTNPSLSLSDAPSTSPSLSPSMAPSTSPSLSLSEVPSTSPSMSPSEVPSSSLTLSGDFVQIGDWRLARVCETCGRSHFSISSQANGKTSQIFRDDGTRHIGHGVRTDYHGFDLTGGTGLTYSTQPIVFGHMAVQIRDWRIRQINSDNLSVTYENGNVSRIYRSDGTVHGNVRSWGGYIDTDLGEPTCAYLTSSFLQLGDWRFGEIGDHLSVTHKDGKTCKTFICEIYVLSESPSMAPSMSPSLSPSGGPSESIVPTALPSSSPSCSKEVDFDICFGKLMSIQDFTIDMVTALDSFDEDKSYSIVQFASSGSLVQSSGDKNSTIDSVNSLVYTGGLTNHAEAIGRCRDALSGTPDRNKYMLLITDGKPNRPQPTGPTDPSPADAAIASADLAKGDDINIILVFIATNSARRANPALDFMSKIDSDGEVFNITDFGSLETLVEELIEQVSCSTDTPIQRLAFTTLAPAVLGLMVDFLGTFKLQAKARVDPSVSQVTNRIQIRLVVLECDAKQKRYT
ncbi:hypothetical protein THAOC_00239 [Thalassiosira oceanica]|uniref:VWFA domain-containing protein n=1 Tax=Thalassiosira oceanica TaxID=159749 RepID=K0TRJ3_THAOC|nr:hypothetical protein THAOC_00239 [Thalassiosira oceanica]|eukprot:EJK77897.1 hypothetical protein THAOC_00239 [Thalassiosira oceanica]